MEEKKCKEAKKMKLDIENIEQGCKTFIGKTPECDKVMFSYTDTQTHIHSLTHSLTNKQTNKQTHTHTHTWI